MKAYFDTAVLVSASVADHPHHTQSLATLQMVRKKTISGHISGHGLRGVCGSDARTIYATDLSDGGMETPLAECAPVFSNRHTDAGDVSRNDTSMRRSWVDRGPNYDALHLCCAKKAACNRIYTFNVRHF